MGVEWKKGFNPKLVLDVVAKIARVEPSGAISYTGMDEIWGRPILVSGLEFSSDVHHSVQDSLVKTGLIVAIRSGNTTLDGVRQAVSTAQSQYLKKPLNDYVLATSISIKAPLPFKNLKIQDCPMAFGRALPKRFDRSALAADIANLVPAGLPLDYAAVRVKCKARLATEAAERALDALAFLRGAWSLCYRWQPHDHLLGIVRRPVAPFVLGPVHTLHRPDGELASRQFWYEPSYRKPLTCQDLSREWEDLHKEERWVWRQISKACDKDKLVKALIRYANALSEPQVQDAFLRLWSLLEYLTHAGRAGYDVTVRRAAFLWTDREYALQALNYLRGLRNRAVHSDESSKIAGTALLHLKAYVDGLIRFLLHPESITRTIAESAELLDLPCEKQVLNQKIQMYEWAKGYRYGRARKRSP